MSNWSFTRSNQSLSWSKEKRACDCSGTVHTFNMNIKSINNLELLLITLLKKETTLLDKFHRLIAYFKDP